MKKKMKNASIILLFHLMFAVLVWNASCKTIPAGAGTLLQSGQTISTYIILIRMQDNGGSMNQLMNEIYRIAFPLNIQVMSNSTFFDNMKEVQVTTGTISESRINIICAELYRLNGVIALSVNKS